MSTLVESKYETVASALEFIEEHREVDNLVIVPGRLISNICVSPVEPIESADQGNEFMRQLLPSDEETSEYQSISIDNFEERHLEAKEGLLLLGRFTVDKVDSFSQFSGPVQPRLTDGDAKGLRNIFGQTRALNPRDPVEKPLMVRFFTSTASMTEMLRTGEHTTSIPLTHIKSRYTQMIEEQISSMEKVIKNSKA
jgi:hypothetical protein